MAARVLLVVAGGLLGPGGATAQTGAQSTPGTQEDRRQTTGASIRLDSPLDRRKVALTKQADAKRDEEIRILKQLIPRAGRERKAEMIFRLADLYWQKSRYRLGLEMERYEAAYAQWVEAGQQGQAPRDRDFLRASSRIKRNALRLYERVLKQYPSYVRNDEVLFNLGNNEYETGQGRKAARHLRALIKRFPNSRLVDDAHLLLGEYHFNGNRVVEARKAYAQAARSDEDRIKYYATYKLAWCDYNVQSYVAGIGRLKRVIAHAQNAPDKNAVRLGTEALNDLARFFSYVDEVESAFAYFRDKAGDQRALKHTTALAALYGEQGKWQQEIQTYRLLLSSYPLSDRAPSLQASIVEAYAKLGRRRNVRQEVERLVERYREGSGWHQHFVSQGAKGRAALDLAYDITETRLRNLVTEYHRDAQKRKDARTYRLARDIYAKYLEAFPNSEAAYEMRYYYAEVLWALLHWRDAAEQYRLVAIARPEGSERLGTYAREAAYNQILAYERVLKAGRDRGSLGRGKRLSEKKKGRTSAQAQAKVKVGQLDKKKRHRERPIPEVEMRLAQACDLYFEVAKPSDRELPAIKFKAAYIFYRYNHFVEAAKRYFEIIDEWPGSRLSKKAANLVLDSLNVQEKWDELAFYAARFRDNQRLTKGDRKFRRQVQQLLEGATYLSIQAAESRAKAAPSPSEQEAQLAKVATRFRAFQGQYPKSEYAPKAAYSAVVLYDEADELDNAIAMAALLKRAYPKSDLRLENDWSLAQFHERIADFSAAAKLYDEFVDRYPKDRRSADALYNAATYYQGLGQVDQAVDRYQTYMQRYPKRDDLAQVYWRICTLREGEDDHARAAQCFDDYGQRFRRAPAVKVLESRYRYARALKAMGRTSKASAELAKILRAHRRLSPPDQVRPSSALAAGYAAFHRLEPEFARYMKQKITLSPRTLRRKLAQAEALACDDKCKRRGRYVAVLDYGNGEYGICALTRIGQVYRNLAGSIRAAPIPRLTPEQEEIYRAELDDRALVPEEKGRQALETALNKAYELGIYNDCTRTAQSNLKQMSPDRFPDLQQRAYLGAEGFITAGLRTTDDDRAPVAKGAVEPPPSAPEARGPR